MWYEIFFGKRKRYTKFDFYITLIGILAYLIIQQPPNTLVYMSVIAIIVFCDAYAKFHNTSDIKNLDTPIAKVGKIPPALMKDKNTLGNSYCIVKYFPKVSKIIVMDHPDSKAKTELRSFVISKENIGDVEQSWVEICSMFDEYTFFEAIFSRIDKQSGVLRLTYINRPPRENISKETVGYKQYKSPKPEYKKEALVVDEYGDPLINIDKLDKNKTQNLNILNEKDNIVEMGDILNPKDNKIDVNIADAQKLSTLPGINIVKAKKIIKYRDINGFFKTKEDFYNVADIKKHFRLQLDDLITVEKTSKIIVENPRRINSERIVD